MLDKITIKKLEEILEIQRFLEYTNKCPYIECVYLGKTYVAEFDLCKKILEIIEQYKQELINDIMKLNEVEINDI